jgi:hypothetical protein
LPRAIGQYKQLPPFIGTKNASEKKQTATHYKKEQKKKRKKEKTDTHLKK